MSWKERVQQYPVDKVAAITEVPASEIAAAARMFANAKQGAIHWGVPIDMRPDGTAVAHAIICLLAITGNIDIPGGQVTLPSYGVSSYPYSSEEMVVQLYGADLVKRMISASARTNIQW